MKVATHMASSVSLRRRRPVGSAAERPDGVEMSGSDLDGLLVSAGTASPCHVGVARRVTY
jgi:hypothetical protein